MTRPTVAQAEAWRPEALLDLAEAWDQAADWLHGHFERVAREIDGSRGHWAGSAADAARQLAGPMVDGGDAAARALITAAVAARDGAGQIAEARAAVLDRVHAARAEGFTIGNGGTASPGADPSPLFVALSGGDPSVAGRVLVLRAAALTDEILAGLDRLGAADADCAQDIEASFAGPPADRPAPTVPAGAWPVQAVDVVAGWPAMSQDRIAGQIAAMTGDQRQRLIEEFPRQVGNTDGVPWDMRIAANHTNIAQAVLHERGDDSDSIRRAAFYRTLLGEIDDPAASRRRVDRQILAFDPNRASLVELHGDLATARSVAVLIPGLNTTAAGSAPSTATARRFVEAGRGDVATVTYLGGPFPQGGIGSAPDAANPRFALDMAPRLVAFSEDVDRTVDATGRAIPVTYVGHSYGGSILGTAESLGLTADRTLYVAAAGAGVGVDDPGDWHNRNPDVLRFSMTAPGDWIRAVQGIPGGPHGVDPDEMPGVIPLETGHYDDGRLMAGPRAHSDVLNRPSDAWRNVLGVITGDRERIQVAS